MKKELRQEVKKSKETQDQSELIKVLNRNKKTIKALGIASFIALTGYSATKLLKDKKMMKKLGKGIKLPSAKKIKNILSFNGAPEVLKVKSSKTSGTKNRAAVNKSKAGNKRVGKKATA